MYEERELVRPPAEHLGKLFNTLVLQQGWSVGVLLEIHVIKGQRLPCQSRADARAICTVHRQDLFPVNASERLTSFHFHMHLVAAGLWRSGPLLAP